MTGLAVGLLLAGAEPEEMITAGIAAVRGQGGIAAGAAIGANITMLAWWWDSPPFEDHSQRADVFAST